MFYKGVLVENLQYSKYYIAKKIIFFIFLKEAVSIKKNYLGLFGLFLVPPRTLVLKCFFKTIEYKIF